MWARLWCDAQVMGKIGSGAWTRTRITSSKGWRATNCTTPEKWGFRIINKARGIS